ncbi:xanthine dehydrogenase accessory protein XdhC [Robbsia andropogonis]|uniref:xanthine dehydrogenase accessory protein XdhC n=1 Tax=Robbsia andropogonis TaxID=28092 RepID=UPI000463971B|nr:xanthine dehydrogenase accessory protein XdhC [Robbsia andropogonis]
MHGARTWLTDLQQVLTHGDPAVLVTMARAEGVTPRGPGARMIIVRDRTFDTIGGGALERHAIDTARQMLRDSTAAVTRHLERIDIGIGTIATVRWHDDPRTEQSTTTETARHDGAVTLAYERLTIADLGWVSVLAKRLPAGLATVRTVSFADNSAVALSDPPDGSGAHPDCLLWDAGPLLTETLVIAPFPVVLFGAGHVGAAIVRLLATLPCQALWVDDRPALLETHASQCGDPPNVTTLPIADPVAAVAQAPAQAHYLVVTHSDALDQAIAEHVLRRGDAVSLAVIGSKAKRRVLAHWLAMRGIDPGHIARMRCPMGLDGLRGDTPEYIAMSAVAQLLLEREQVVPPPAAQA